MTTVPLIHRFPGRAAGYPRQQRGFALIVALVLIVGLTMVAVISMRITVLDLQMAKNAVDYRYALQVSEGSRILGTRALDNHAFYRDWSTGFTLPAGITPTSPNGNLYLNNNAPSSDMTVANRDMTYAIDVDGDGNTTDDADLRADIYVTRVGRSVASGAGIGIGSGYAGLGRGVVGGGGFLFFDIRSRGYGVNNASATTVSHYRYVIRS